MRIIWVILSFISFIFSLKVIPLHNVTIFAEDLGDARLYHETWHSYVSIDVDNIHTRFNNIMELYEVTSEMCENCIEQIVLTLISSRMQRLNSQRKLLYKLVGKTNRNKRGWINSI